MLKISNKQKEIIIQRFRSGESVTNLSRELSISRSRIYNWIRNSSKNNTKVIATHKADLMIKKANDKLEVLKLVN